MKLKSTATTLLMLATLTGFGCTKQNSQQNNVDSRETDARRDVSNQPNIQQPNESGKDQITTNPNSTRQGPDSTLDTSHGAAIVNGQNMNPRAEGPGASTPTSVDTSNTTEPRTSDAVKRADCQDTKPGTSCPPTAQNPLRDEDTQGQLPQKQ